jgi:Kdo2-lipid IVA lauroyltransferase/acyltransferase
MQPSLFKRLRHALEWAVLQALFALFRLIGLHGSSAMMGRLARWLGPKVRRKSTIARRNLQAAFPEWSEERLDATIAGMWENIGRYLGEFPHIARLSKDEFLEIADIQGIHHLQAATAQGGALFFSAHMANWELGAKASWACGHPFAIVYRPLNNPWADRIANDHRDCYQLRGLPKNAAGSRELIRTLRDGEPVAMLIDQKLSAGQPIEFFGREAMTSTAIADLAVKYGYPIIPTRVERVSDAPSFRITFEAPVQWENTGNMQQDAIAIMEKLHGIMEGWIRAHPAQWFWVHKRWG